MSKTTREVLIHRKSSVMDIQIYLKNAGTDLYISTIYRTLINQGLHDSKLNDGGVGEFILTRKTLSLSSLGYKEIGDLSFNKAT